MPDPTRVPDRRDVRFAYGTVTRSGAIFQRASARARLIPRLRPHDPGRCPARFRLVPVRSPLLRESRLISFPPGTEMFQFPGSPRAFRDRRSLGSSPGLFAAFHARILMTPRHPPRALRSLTTPIRPPRLAKGAGADRGGLTAARALPAAASRDAAAGPGPTSRSVRVRSSSAAPADSHR